MNKIELIGTAVDYSEHVYTRDGVTSTKVYLQTTEPKFAFGMVVGKKNWRYLVMLIGQKAQYNKGDQLEVVGSFSTKSWKVDDIWKSQLVIIAQSVKLIQAAKEADEHYYDRMPRSDEEQDYPF